MTLHGNFSQLELDVQHLRSELQRLAVSDPIRVGDIVHGHLGGWFGRDHYDCARVEAVGADWAVIRTLGDGTPVTGSGAGIVDVLAENRDPKVTECHSSGCREDNR